MLPIREMTFHRDSAITAPPRSSVSISSYLVWDNVDIMQSTWLFDKDGKEIYEGDILWSNHLWEIQVEWTIAYDEDLARIVFLQTNWAFEEINKANLNLLEVVGNIYENPELVKK